MRTSGDTIFTDARAREATARSFDRERWIEIVGQGEGVVAGPWPQPFFGAWSLAPGDPDFDDFIRHDPQRTRALLDALRADGVDVDREFKLSIIGTDLATNDLAVFGKAQLEEAGWNVRVEPVPSAEISSRLLRKAAADFDWWISPSRTADPIQGLRSYHSDPRSITETFSQPGTELDAMIEDWERTIDADEIAEKARNIQRWLIQNWPSAFLLFNQFDRTLFQSTFRNINTVEGAAGLFSWIDESYRGG
jgi:ABC-type transport system substrate-binding protein